MVYTITHDGIRRCYCVKHWLDHVAAPRLHSRHNLRALCMQESRMGQDSQEVCGNAVPPVPVTVLLLGVWLQVMPVMCPTRTDSSLPALATALLLSMLHSMRLHTGYLTGGLGATCTWRTFYQSPCFALLPCTACP